MKRKNASPTSPRSVSFVQFLKTYKCLTSWRSREAMLYVQIAHNPIFFHSPFTVGLWKIFIGNQLDINPSSASEKIFILQLFTYNMWREHNCRTFRQTSSSERAINEGQASLHSGYVVYSSLYARDLILLHCTFQLRMLTSLSVCFPSSLLSILLCFITLVCFHLLLINYLQQTL